MSLKIRKYYLKNLSKKFKARKINDLMYEVKIPENLFYNLKNATINYISRCFNDNETVVTEKNLIKKILSKHNKLKNLTPNGIIVPKIESSLEFNNLLKSYVQLLKFLNLENSIEKFHFPPNLRLKLPNLKKKKYAKKTPN